MKKILFIGFSLTIQKNGYIDSLKKNIKGKFSIYTYAIGGANISHIAYLLDDIDFSSYDAVIFEISTCYRWLGNDSNAYKKILKYLVDYTKNSISRIGFLDFTREDVDINDELHNAVRYTCKENNLPYFSWKDPIEEYVYDGIHPNAKGVRSYASLANALIDTLFDDFPETLECSEKSNNYKLKFLPFSNLFHYPSTESRIKWESFEKGGVKQKLIVIEQSENIDLEIDDSYIVEGILLKIGPKTGLMHINTSAQSIKKLPYDERNYYERFFPLLFTLDASRKISISCERSEDRPKLLKGKEFNGPQNISIAGLFVSYKKFLS